MYVLQFEYRIYSNEHPLPPVYGTTLLHESSRPSKYLIFGLNVEYFLKNVIFSKLKAQINASDYMFYLLNFDIQKHPCS